MGTFLLTAAGAIVALMIIVWLTSVIVRDASIVDIAWGFGFVVVAWACLLVDNDPGALQWLSVILTTIWGLRLAGYLAKRNLGHGEDFRYQSMRRRQGDLFWLKSLVTVFGLQGVIMWIVSLPVQIVHAPGVPRGLGPLAIIGALIWLVGFGFESIGDLQMARFKADPANEGKIMDQGLWSWTRHPNYFGDACVWWGLGLVGLAAGWAGIAALIGPTVMNIFLVRVSGKALLERAMRKRRPGYDEYVARTSGFFPRPPRASNTA